MLTNPETANPFKLLKTQESIRCHYRLDLVRFLRQMHHNTGHRTLHNPEHRYQRPVCQVSFFLSWDIRMHDVQLVDTTCTADQDEDEERDVVHHELRQPQSDASWSSEDETWNVRSVVFGKMPSVPKIVDFPPVCEEDFPFLLPFLPLPRDSAGLRSVDG